MTSSMDSIDSNVLVTTSIDLAENCPLINATSRKSADPSGDGKTWRIGAYWVDQPLGRSNVVRENIDYEEVDNLSCSLFTYYNQLHSGDPPSSASDYSRAVKMAAGWQDSFTDTEMRTLTNESHDYIQSGNTDNVQPTNHIGSVNLVARNRYGGEQLSGSEWIDPYLVGWFMRDNWARTCMKNSEGYFLTNPYTGVPLINWNEGASFQTNTPEKKANYHKDACCGFLNRGIKEAGDPEFCHPDYCNIGNRVSQKCRERLVELCDDDEEFVLNDRCNIPFWSYWKDNNWTTAIGKDTAMIAAASRYSLSLSPDDYSRIGKRVCTPENDESIFDKPSSGDPERAFKGKLRDKCIKWCGAEPDECKDIITEYCEGIYNESIANNGVATQRFKDAQNICACNWPQKFYDDMRDTYINDFNVPPNTVPNTRHCINYNCMMSQIGDTSNNNQGGIYHSPSSTSCPSQNILNCIQQADINVEGDILVKDGGRFTFKPELTANCNLSQEVFNNLSSYHSGNNNVVTTEATNSETTDSPTDEEGDATNNFFLNEDGSLSTTGIIIIVVSVVILLVILGLIMKYST